MVKFAFFDVDGTLSVPVYKGETGDVIGFTDEGWVAYCAENGEDAYRYCRSVRPVGRYAKELAASGVRLFVLTASMSGPETEAKRKFIRIQYPGLFEDVLAVSADREKLMVMKEIAEQNGGALENCELVEDTYATLLYVQEYGVKATHISQLVWDL